MLTRGAHDITFHKSQEGRAHATLLKRSLGRHSAELPRGLALPRVEHEARTAHAPAALGGLEGPVVPRGHRSVAVELSRLLPHERPQYPPPQVEDLCDLRPPISHAGVHAASVIPATAVASGTDEHQRNKSCV